MEKIKVRIDKDYCSSTVWHNGANWEETDFNFNEDQLELAENYNNLWEAAHRDIECVDEGLYEKAEQAKYKLLNNLYRTRKDIIWTFWDDHDRCEVVYEY